MKKILVLMMLAVCVQAEMFGGFWNNASKNKFVVLESGDTLRVGDTLQVGVPHKNLMYGTDRYEFIKREGGAPSNTAIQYVQQEKNIMFRKMIIRNVWHNEPTIFRNPVDVVEIGGNALFSGYFVDINNAIRYAEIALKMNDHPTNYQTMTDTLAFAFYVKDRENEIDKYMEEYAYRFQNDLFNKNIEDEFEYSRVLRLAKNELLSKMNALEYGKTYSVLTNLKVGNYDFKNHGFPLYDKRGYPLEQDTLMLTIVHESGSRESNMKKFSLYGRLHLLLVNIKDFGFLQIAEDEANYFVKRRKNDWLNSVDREVYARINFKVKHLSENELSSQPIMLKNAMETSVWCEVESIEFYEFDNYRYNWLGTITK
ncbi:MAG: DUF4852 domain-containing protein [Paludibacteraceae bacterium]|nr:DUF4852 domain-containing protein [Paludibacteraceae bacterium]MDD6357568.1 DUF4852 domain-containing protein [Bacteroidales bacterium]